MHVLASKTVVQFINLHTLPLLLIKEMQIFIKHYLDSGSNHIWWWDLPLCLSCLKSQLINTFKKPSPSVPGGTEASEEGDAFILQSLSNLSVFEPGWDQRSGRSFVTVSPICELVSKLYLYSTFHRQCVLQQQCSHIIFLLGAYSFFLLQFSFVKEQVEVCVLMPK